MTATTNWVVVGRVVKAHGIRGEVVVESLSDIPDRLVAGTAVELDGRAAAITSSRPHQGRLLVQFEGVPDRTTAEGLRGRSITAAPLDTDGYDEFFAHELVGLEVLDDADRVLGVVDALIELPPAAGYDLLEVRRADGTSWWLPAVDEYVEVVDEPDLALRLVDPPDGLVDPPEGLAEDLEPPAKDAPR